MGLGPHAVFVISAYAVAAVVVLALIGWVLADHRAQRRLLVELEAEGVVRRSHHQEVA